MEIKSIEIKNIMGSLLQGENEGITVNKILPCISVVQSVHGRYELSLNGCPSFFTDEGGAFVTPSGAHQHIVHHVGSQGFIKAQWVFMDVTVNGIFAFEDVFEMPQTLSADYRDRLYRNITDVIFDTRICKRYAAAYELVDIIIENSVMLKEVSEPSAANLKRYIEEHYAERLSKERLAEEALCSVPNLYRIFQRNFGMSPHNYVNKTRLEKAALLLEHENITISEAAHRVGIDDEAYFSKLFKDRYGTSPMAYRRSLLRNSLIK